MNAKIERGFSIIEILIIVAVVGLIGLLGWRAWDAANQPVENSTSQVKSSDVPEVRSNQDLDSVDKMLDDTNVDGDYDKELESGTSF